MKGDTKVIELLNEHLKKELTAINQYFLHSKILKDWGVDKLGDYEYKESIEEMKHADELIERILFLEGLPNLQDLNRLRIGENIEEIIKCDLEMELEAVTFLKTCVEHCESVKDFTSRDLFQRILISEEEHVDFLETQLSLIEKMGVERYIQLNSSEVK